MAKLINAANISEGWVLGMDHLISQGGKASNLIIAIAVAGQEVLEVRSRVDVFLKSRENGRLRRIRKVADTIFPVDFYQGPPGEVTRQHLYRMQRLAARVERRFIPRGTYFDRLINWPGSVGKDDELASNQLERRVRLMQTYWDNGIRNSNAYEFAFSTGTPSDDAGEAWTGDLRLQDPMSDNIPIGFPCLSHISLTLFGGRLDLTAVYRNQHFISKAYGNFVGLSDLQRFICLEVGCTVGELICVATHADAEMGKNGVRKVDIKELIRECRTTLTSDSLEPQTQEKQQHGT